jgi:hypothetical protein
MALNGMQYHWMWAYGGDNGISSSVQLNFSPVYTVAQVSLSGADGDGLCRAGVTQYLSQSPSGAPVPTNFAWDTNFGHPPSVFDPTMISVSAELDVGGGGQSGVATLSAWFFS